MNAEEKQLHFFLGANTPQGFVSRFDQLASVEDDWRLFVIKGGPGSGKSTMMKTIAGTLGGTGEPVEIIHCSSDVDSIDGVIFPERRFAIADGTPPHAIEPKYPGAFESLVDMTACWDAQKLFASRKPIVALTGEISRCHTHCCRYLAAAGALLGDTCRIALDSVNTAKLAAYSRRLAEREFKPALGRPARESVRFLSAVTNKGPVCFIGSVGQLCDRVYLVNDAHGAVSRLLLTALRTRALEAGYDVISSYCPLGPFDKLEHLLIPALRLGFVTSNHFHEFGQAVEPYRIVNSQRFIHAEQLKAHRKRIQFNGKSAAQMLRQAEDLLRDAKQLHDELESYYISATDFARVDALTAQLITRLSDAH